MTASELQAAFLAKMKESGLTKSDADKLGLRPYLKDEALRRFPGLSPSLVRDGFVLPYHTLDGKVNGFYRWRNLDRTVSGFRAQTKDPDPPPKYLQATGSCAELFLPFLPGVEWKQWAEDIEQFFLTTEGELKAGRAMKEGFPTFAIGGVDMFAAKKRNLWLLKSFDWFLWQGRKVYVILDSDALTNPRVRDAGSRYCSRLSGLGARVYQLILPSMPGLKKVGLDDYLEHKEGGKDQLVL